MNLPVPIPQILPIDLKLFGSDSKQDDNPGNQGDSPQPEHTPLAKTNEKLEQLKKSLSTQGREPQQGAQNQMDQSDDQQSQKQKNTPQESGGGIKFNPPQDNTGKKQAPHNTSGQQQQAPQPGQKPDAQQPPSGGDPQRGGHQQHRHAPQQSSQEKQPQQPHQSKWPNQSDPQPGKSGGQGKGERFYKPGRQPGGFLTQDAGYVKVRIPTGYQGGRGQPGIDEKYQPGCSNHAV